MTNCLVTGLQRMMTSQNQGGHGGFLRIVQSPSYIDSMAEISEVENSQSTIQWPASLNCAACSAVKNAEEEASVFMCLW